LGWRMKSEPAVAGENAILGKRKQDRKLRRGDGKLALTSGSLPLAGRNITPLGNLAEPRQIRGVTERPSKSVQKSPVNPAQARTNMIEHRLNGPVHVRIAGAQHLLELCHQAGDCVAVKDSEEALEEKRWSDVDPAIARTAATLEREVAQLRRATEVLNGK